MARPVVSMLPAHRIVTPRIDVTTEYTEYTVVPADESYDDYIQEAASKYDLDPALIRAVMQTESAFDPFAVSRAGAEGLMQLMPEVADELGVTDSFDPRDNIMGGARYLRLLLDLHSGDIDTTLASYNAGPGNVERYGGVPPFKETQNYVRIIKRLLRQTKKRPASAD